MRGFLAKKEEDWAKNVAKNVILENVKVKEGGKTVKTDVFGSNLIYNQFWLGLLLELKWDMYIFVDVLGLVGAGKVWL